MNIRPIRSKEEYEKALETIEELMTASPGTPEFDTLEVLAMLVENFEEQHYPIDLPHPIDAILFRLEQMGLERSALDEILGARSRTSEILNLKRKLSLAMIRNLHDKLRIPLEVLVADYELDQDSDVPAA